MHVAVDDSSVHVPVSGRYAVRDSVVEFSPRFALDAGRAYRVQVNPARLGIARSDSAFSTRVMLPAGDQTPRTFVLGIYPSGDTVPENLLRIYIEFSAPMSRVGGLDFITLRDSNDKVVNAAFLPLDADFWNTERTRYTAFLDPGRVKRGILPNEQLGRAILAGRQYSVVVDSSWRDEHGLPLTATYRKRLSVAPPDERIVAVKDWRITAPSANSRDALVVRFTKPLDHGLLQRAIGVESSKGAPIDGDITITQHEMEWQFTPREAWRAGDFKLIVLTLLEDPAGNRTDKPFEVDMFDRVDRTPTPERQSLPFRIR